MSRCPGYGVYILLAYMLILGALAAPAAQVGQAVQWAEGDTDGWRLLDLQTGQYVEGGLTVVDGALEWKYLSEDSGDKYRVSANLEASNGDFVGDYFDDGVAVLDLELYADVSTELTVELWHAADLLYYTAESSVHAGWQRIQIPINTDFFSAGFGSSENVEDWIENIGELLIGTSRGTGDGEQIYRLRNVVLKGSGSGYASWIQPYIDRDGGTLADWLPSADYCGDGDANADEHIARTDPGDPEDKLLARLSASPLGLHWDSKLGRVYSVWSSALDGNEFVKISGSDIEGTGSEIDFAIEDDSSYRTSVYKIEVKLKQ